MADMPSKELPEDIKEKVIKKMKEEKEKEKPEYKEFSLEDFVDKYTAREYFETQPIKIKEQMYDLIPSVIVMLKSKMTEDELFDLDIKEFMSLIRAYNARMGVKRQKIDFLGIK